MPRYAKILVPVDLSDMSPEVFRQAHDLGRKFDSQLHLLHVVEPWKPAIRIPSAAAYAELLADQQSRASAALDGLIEADRPVDIITDRDIALALLSGDASRDTPVKKVMQKQVRTVWADHGIFDACQAFAGYKVRRLPVIDRSEKLVGIISVDDVVAMLARELFNISQALEPALHVKM